MTEPLTDPDDAALPDPDPAEPTSPARTGRRVPVLAVVIVAGLVLAGTAVGAGLALSNGSPRTGKECLVGTWHSDGIRVSPDEVRPGTLDSSFRSDGTGENHLVAREDKDGKNTVTDRFDFTFHYAATDTTIAYTQVEGTVVTADPAGAGPPSDLHVSQLSDSTYTCRGDRLTIGSGEPGLTQTLTRR